MKSPTSSAVAWTCLGLKDNKESAQAAIFLILGLLSSIGSGVSVCTWATNSSDLSQQLSDYKTVKWQTGKIEKVHVNDIPVIIQAQRWNEKIQEHRDKKDSYWVGLWYLKEIAELEPIKLPD